MVILCYQWVLLLGLKNCTLKVKKKKVWLWMYSFQKYIYINTVILTTKY